MSDSGCVCPNVTAVVTPALTTGTVSVLATVPAGRALILTLDMLDLQVVPGLGGDRVPALGQEVEGHGRGDGLGVGWGPGAEGVEEGPVPGTISDGPTAHRPRTGIE